VGDVARCLELGTRHQDLVHEDFEEGCISIETLE
jgi:hypothetical protein